MNTYKKYACAVQLLSVVVVISNILLTIMHWFFPAMYTSVCQDMGFAFAQDYNTAPFTWGQMLGGFLIESIASMILIYGLFQVIPLMNAIKKNNYFTLETITLFARITKMTCLYAMYTMMSTTLLSLITSLHNAPGERMILVRFGGADLANIMIFCFMFLMMSIFKKGYELKHEQELTI